MASKDKGSNIPSFIMTNLSNTNYGYTIVPNISLDKCGTEGLKGLGLYHYLFSRKGIKNFSFSKAGIKSELTCGDRTLSTAIKFLKGKKLLATFPIMDDVSKKYLGYDWQTYKLKTDNYSSIPNDAIVSKLPLEVIGLFCFINLQSHHFKKRINQTQLAYKLGLQTKTLRGYLKKLVEMKLAHYNKKTQIWSFKEKLQTEDEFRINLFQQFGADYPICPYRFYTEVVEGHEIKGSLMFNSDGLLVIDGLVDGEGNSYRQTLPTHEAFECYEEIRDYMTSEDYQKQSKMTSDEIVEFHLDLLL